MSGVPHPRLVRVGPLVSDEGRRCWSGRGISPGPRQGGAVPYGGLEMRAPPLQGAGGAPEGIKVGEGRVPAGSYLRNVIKVVPFKLHRGHEAYPRAARYANLRTC